MRVLLAALLAVTLGAGSASASAATVDTGQSAHSVTLEEFCDGVSDVIAFLESRPASPLRDFLLGKAQRLFARYCSGS
jgi:hypothetical protein